MQMFTSPIVSQRWKPRMELKPSKFSYDNYVTNSVPGMSVEGAAMDGKACD